MIDIPTIKNKNSVGLPHIAINDNHEGVQQGRRIKAIKEDEHKCCNCFLSCGRIVTGLLFESVFVTLTMDFYEKKIYAGVGGCVIGCALSLVLIQKGIKRGCKIIRQGHHDVAANESQ